MILVCYPQEIGFLKTIKLITARGSAYVLHAIAPLPHKRWRVKDGIPIFELGNDRSLREDAKTAEPTRGHDERIINSGVLLGPELYTHPVLKGLLAS